MVCSSPGAKRGADRITGQAWTGGPRTVTVSYAYDGAGNLKTQTDSDSSGTTSWTYDGRNQVLSKNASSGGGTLAYCYDGDGNMITTAAAAARPALSEVHYDFPGDLSAHDRDRHRSQPGVHAVSAR